jgi:hypothetical protein
MGAFVITVPRMPNAPETMIPENFKMLRSKSIVSISNHLRK